MAFEAAVVDAPVPVERIGRSSEPSCESFEDVSIGPSSAPSECRLEDLFDVEDRVTALLKDMVLTHERFLRATPAHRVIQRAGHAFRAPRANFADSRSVNEISTFISHSWQASSASKILTLQLFFHLKPAVLVSNLAAASLMVLYSFNYLPGFEKTPRFGTETVMLGTWSLSAGVDGVVHRTLTAFVVLKDGLLITQLRGCSMACQRL